MVEGEEDAATVQTLGDLQAANAQEEGGVLTPQEREVRLVAALDRSIALQLELLDRLRRLEEMQQGLKSRLDTLQDGEPATTRGRGGAGWGRPCWGTRWPGPGTRGTKHARSISRRQTRVVGRSGWGTGSSPLSTPWSAASMSASPGRGSGRIFRRARRQP